MNLGIDLHEMQNILRYIDTYMSNHFPVSTTWTIQNIHANIDQLITITINTSMDRYVDELTFVYDKSTKEIKANEFAILTKFKNAMTGKSLNGTSKFFVDTYLKQNDSEPTKVSTIDISQYIHENSSYNILFDSIAALFEYRMYEDFNDLCFIELRESPNTNMDYDFILAQYNADETWQFV